LSYNGNQRPDTHHLHTPNHQEQTTHQLWFSNFTVTVKSTPMKYVYTILRLV
jgi:hypothetical protein